MSNEVYANGREVSCKSGSGKSICAFPDVCLTPPAPPAGPLPIPYPNTGVTSDTSDGSKTVQISGKEVMLKDSSRSKKSTGDEAATKSQGMSVMTHNIQGSCYFTSWSMDVKIEGENAVRHLDLMTHNHACTPGSTPPWTYQDLAAFNNVPECAEQAKEHRKQCEGNHSGPGGCTPACKAAKACILVKKEDDKELCCDPDKTGHHMIEDQWVKNNPNFAWYGAGGRGSPGYEQAPTLCGSEQRWEDSHESMHNIQGVYMESFLGPTATRPAGVNHDPTHPSGGFTYGEGKRATLNAHDATHGGDEGCRKCVEAQLDSYYVRPGTNTNNSTPLNRPVRRQGLGARRAPTLGNWGSSIGSR